MQKIRRTLPSPTAAATQTQWIDASNKAFETRTNSWRHQTSPARRSHAATLDRGSERHRQLHAVANAQRRACCKTHTGLRANDLLLCVRHRIALRIAAVSTALSRRFSAASERIPVKRRFFSVVSSFPYWRRAAVALHFALPTGSADPTPPTITEHITHGKNRR
ncbi:hypothetical protein [Xanthomonas arboricola]|uniref:hypothetical protein n=1 Tax=Xanthomonas arboricola TaxID=56448 RepID=UPI0011B067E9|nr:hypothetical protein [Xanthomonas arboricola]